MKPIVSTKITIGGLAGTGKGTISKLLAKILGYELKSAGEYFHEIAKKEGLEDCELEEKALLYQRYDLAIDERTAFYGRENNQFIFDGRVAWYCIPDSVKILLVCDSLGERWKRIADREKISFEKARDLTIHREASAKKRYQALYKIKDITDKNHYDLVLDTMKVKPENNVATIIGHLSYDREMKK